MAATLSEGLAEAEFWRRSKLPGVGDPIDLRVTHHPDAASVSEPPPPERAHALAKAADAALRRGNAVRAAIACTQAVAASPTGSTKHRHAAKAAIEDRLVPALMKSIDGTGDTAEAWTDALMPVLTATVESGWPPAAKFLYELQRIAADLGREIYAVDAGGWLSSLGRRPMLRKLTLQRRAILLIRLRKAAKHLDKASLSEHARHDVEALLHREMDQAEKRLREAVAPVILSCFDLVGIVPRSAVETVARNKVVAEILDRICERGHIRLGDMRDAFARNAFKFPDLSGPAEFFRGDALLRADALLAREMDGIYHRGEFYLRGFQRGSALAFGTRIGRAITKFAAIPIIAALMTVAFAQYLEHEGKTIAGAVTGVVKAQEPEPEYYVGLNAQGQWDLMTDVVEGHKAIEFTNTSWIAVGILAFIYLLVVNSPPVRSAVFELLKLLGRFLSFTLFTLPGILWHSEPMRMLRRNAAMRLFTRHILLPFVVAFLIAAFVAAFGGSHTLVIRYWVGVFVAFALVSLTPFGAAIREGTEEVADDAWRNLRYNLLPGFFSTIAWFFREVLRLFESAIYTIDEWFRYREGQSKPSLALKVALGLVWFPIAYAFRFAIFLLIEPQVNPLKHFPTVTVSHKLLLPMIPTVASATNISIELVGAVFTGIPGIFGFLVWELKENWKLYEANRREYVGAVPLGHHGETMRGLLRPGFHSGTVPAEYRRIRNAIRHASATGGNAYAPKPLDGLHAVEHALHSFTERDLIAPLSAAKSWVGLTPTCICVKLAVQSVRIKVAVPSLAEEPTGIVFWHSEGSIFGRVAAEGFIPQLNAEQLAVWKMALRGFFAYAAVEGENAFVEWRDWREFWDAAG